MKLLLASAALISGLFALPAQAAGIAYISSATGYVLGGGATAVTANWTGQAPLSGFTGYGQIKWNGKCLTGRAGGQPLTWESCQVAPAQNWKLSNKRLNNEGGWCADVEGGRNGANVRVMAWKCDANAGNQRWNSHFVESAKVAASRIADPKVASTLVATAQTAQPGALISKATGKLVSDRGGALIGNDGSTLVAAGGGNLVAAGGGN